MITDMNGQMSLAKRKHDRRNNARKNQRIILGEDRSSIVAPFSNVLCGFDAIHGDRHGLY